MFVATLLTAAQPEASPPLLDMDGTIFVQFALFLLMLFVLSRLVFRPYLKLKEARHEGIEGARHEASAMQEKARAVGADYDAQLGRARLRGAEERQRLRTEGAVYERQVLGAARDEAQKALEAARAKIAQDAEQAHAKLQAESTALSQEIAQKILGRKVA